MSTFEIGVVVFVLLFMVGGLVAGHVVTKMTYENDDQSNE